MGRIKRIGVQGVAGYRINNNRMGRIKRIGVKLPLETE
jgi:hypothetical protein